MGAVRVFADRVELPLKSGPTLALLQYFATLFLSTRLQLSFSVLGALLGFAGLHPDLAHLRNLCVHALHEGLEDGAYPSEGVYQLAREEGCEGLRVRSGRMLSRVSPLLLVRYRATLTLKAGPRGRVESSGTGTRVFVLFGIDGERRKVERCVFLDLVLLARITYGSSRISGGSSSQGTSNYGASNYDPGSPPDSQLSLPTPYDRRPSLPPRSSTHSSSSTSGALCDFSSPSRPPYRSRHGSEPPADRLLSDGSERTVASWSSHTSLMSTVVEPSHAHIVSIPERAEPLFIFEEAGFSVPSERMRRPLSPPLPSRPISPPYSFARTEPTLLPAIPHPSPIDERVFPNLPPKDETVTHSSASTITPTPLPSPPSPPPAPYEAPQGPLPPPLVQASKHLSTSLPCPPKLAFMPGGTLSLTLENLANVPLRNAFSAITIHGIGISLLQGGNLLPSRHVILDQKLDVDLFRSGETSSMVVDFVLPDEVECKCRREGTVLPASAAVRLGSALGSSAAEGSGILIGYKLEITGKRKGWQKRTEKCVVLSFISPATFANLAVSFQDHPRIPRRRAQPPRHHPPLPLPRTRARKPPRERLEVQRAERPQHGRTIAGFPRRRTGVLERDVPGERPRRLASRFPHVAGGRRQARRTLASRRSGRVDRKARCSPLRRQAGRRRRFVEDVQD